MPLVIYVFFVCVRVYFQAKRSSLMRKVIHLCIDTYICTSTGVCPDIFSRDETVVFTIHSFLFWLMCLE